MRASGMTKARKGPKGQAVDPAYQPQPMAGLMMAGWVVALVIGASLPMDWATYAALLGWWPAMGVLALILRG